MTKRVNWSWVSTWVMLPCTIVIIWATINDRDMTRNERLAVAAQANVEYALVKYRTTKIVNDMDAIISDLKRLSRGMILDYQAREIARIMSLSCDDNITPRLVMRLIERESNFNPHAVGAQGEVGLAQVKPTTVNRTRAELLDPVINVESAIMELKRLRAIYNDTGLAVVSYGTGENSTALKGVKYIMGGQK
jgi:hypothetical protein